MYRTMRGRASGAGEAWYPPGNMSIELTTLSEPELEDLHRRIAERLRVIRAAQIDNLARFSVGMVVEFTSEDGRSIRGAIARLDRQTATIVSTAGSWPVAPSLLRVPTDVRSARWQD